VSFDSSENEGILIPQNAAILPALPSAGILGAKCPKQSNYERGKFHIFSVRQKSKNMILGQFTNEPMQQFCATGA
jgi:hypothetical protein